MPTCVTRCGDQGEGQSSSEIAELEADGGWKERSLGRSWMLRSEQMWSLLKYGWSLLK